MAFDTQTVTIKGAELLAAATAANQLIIDGCDATTGYMTQAQAVNVSARPASPVSNTTDVTQLGSTAEHINSRVYFRTGVNAGGDVNTLFLYGHSASAPNDKFVIFVASSQTPFHLPVAGDVIDEWECALDIVYTINSGAVGFATQATYCSLSEFNLLKERTVTTHKESAPTTGENQIIYGDKTFEDEIIFISPNNWKMTLSHDGFKIVDSVDTQKVKIDPTYGIISTTGSIISNSLGVYSTLRNLNVTDNLSVGKDASADTFTCGNLSWAKQLQSGNVVGGEFGILNIGSSDKSYLHAFSSNADNASISLNATRGGVLGAQVYLGGQTNSESSTQIVLRIREPNDSGSNGLRMAWDAVKLCYAATFDMPVTFDENIYPQKSINLSGNQAKVVSTNSGGTQTASFYDGTIDMTGGSIRISDSNRPRLFADSTGIYAYNATDGSLVFSVNSGTGVVTINGDLSVDGDVALSGKISDDLEIDANLTISGGNGLYVTGEVSLPGIAPSLTSNKVFCPVGGIICVNPSNVSGWATSKRVGSTITITSSSTIPLAAWNATTNQWDTDDDGNGNVPIAPSGTYILLTGWKTTGTGNQGPVFLCKISD